MAIPFKYNDIEELEEIVRNHDIGVIIMEPFRNEEPKDNFLQRVRDITTEHNIVLIFDEITSGFRNNVGGIHLNYGIKPDVAIFGKAMGNGYGISAIIGKREIMECAQSTFISSTFWTERTGPVAALKTIEIMERDDVAKLITDYGLYINRCWKKLSTEHDLGIQISGLPALTHFSFSNGHELIYKTLITQEMLKKGYLVTNSVYVCIFHTRNIIDRYITALDSVFSKIEEIEGGLEPGNYLEGPVCHAGFERLN